MKGKDEIAELFKEGLKDFESNVDPSLWSGVQSGLNAAGGAASGSSAVGSSLGKLSILSKTIVGVTAATAISVGTYFAVNTDSSSENTTENVVENVADEDVKEPIDDEFSQNEEKTSNDDNVNENAESFTLDSEPEREEEITEEEPTIDDTKENNDKSSYNEPQAQPNSQMSNNTSNSEKDNSTSSASSSSPNSFTVEKTETEKEEEENEEFNEVELIVDLIKHENQFIELSADAKHADEVVWEMGDGTVLYGNRVQYYYDEPGNYKIEIFASNDISEKYDDLSINVEKKGEISRLPNVFTPNKRGKFDKFFIESQGIDEFNLTIFNDKQEIVYQTDDASFEWDGIHWKKNIPVESGDYYYVIIAKDAAGNTINKHEGLEIKSSK